MYTLEEIIIAVLVSCAIVGYLSYQLGQFILIAKMLGKLTDEELDRLDELTAKLESAKLDSDAEKILDSVFKKSKSLTQVVMSGQIFLYDEHNNFVAQGNSAEEAAAVFYKSEYSSSLATVECSEGNTYQIVDGKVKSLSL